MLSLIHILFDRVGRNIYLNDCGQSFYAFVSPALALLENAVRSVDDFKQQRMENLVLGSVSQTYLQLSLIHIWPASALWNAALEVSHLDV